MGQYKRHVFVCTSGEYCPFEGSAAIHKFLKDGVQARGLKAEIRVNKSGCLDRCAGGPVAVVYPDATWYTYVDEADIDEIVDSHLKQGKIVERLLLPPDIGR